MPMQGVAHGGISSTSGQTTSKASRGSASQSQGHTRRRGAFIINAPGWFKLSGRPSTASGHVVATPRAPEVAPIVVRDPHAVQYSVSGAHTGGSEWRDRGTSAADVASADSRLPRLALAGPAIP